MLLTGVLLTVAVGVDPTWTSLTAHGLSDWRPPLSAWVVVGDVETDPLAPGRFKAIAGSGTLLNGPNGKTSNLLTNAEHGDMEAHIEFIVPAGSNSGVYFLGRYEIQIFDSYGVDRPKYSDCGGVYQRWKNDKGFEGRPPRVNASKRPGEWQSFDVVFQAPRFNDSGKKIKNARFVKVLLNGVVIHENAELSGPTRASAYEDEKPLGPLMLQGDHGPVAYRNLRWRPLSGRP